ncbi:MAG: hypothetical protein Ct9H300mP16_02170 [Pseudomonadota bacterium]|nr:MAG: hypothetical protein Ct9H300mP16_02170 [Pseudomonadota bacterium]
MGGSDLRQSAVPHDANSARHHHGFFERMGDVDKRLPGFSPLDILDFLFQGFSSL